MSELTALLKRVFTFINFAQCFTILIVLSIQTILARRSPDAAR